MSVKFLSFLYFLLDRHNDRSKEQEREVLEQGLPSVGASTSSEPLPPIAPLHPELLPVPLIQAPHEFALPENTVGQARIRQPSRETPPPTPPIPIMPRFPMMMQVPFPLPQQQQAQNSAIPDSTKSYRKKKREEELAGQAPKRYK